MQVFTYLSVRVKLSDKHNLLFLLKLAQSKTEAKKLSDYRDLVKQGKEQFKKELQELGSDGNSMHVAGSLN